MDLSSLNAALILNGLVVVAGGFLINQLKAGPSKLWGLVLRCCSITIETPENNDGFHIIRQFIAQQRFLFRVRKLSLLRRMGKDGQQVWDYPPSPGSHYFWWEGRPACFHRHRRELEGGGHIAVFETLTVRFFLGDRGTISRFLAAAEKFCEIPPDEVLRIQGFSGGNWSPLRERDKRSLGTVFLPGGLVADLVAKIGEFHRSRDWYRDHGIPHRMGILLEGPPGNGKTTLIKALASHFNRTLVTIPLGSRGTDDERLLSVFGQLNQNFVVAEDVDCLTGFDGRERPGSDSQVGSHLTFSGLLNAIDGVASSEGYVLFFTTNHPEKLDPALLRPGRIDHVIHIGNVERGQGGAYFRSFYGPGHEAEASAFVDRFADGMCSMAELQNHLMTYRDAPAEAAVAPILTRVA